MEGDNETSPQAADDQSISNYKQKSSLRAPPDTNTEMGSIRFRASVAIEEVSVRDEDSVKRLKYHDEFEQCPEEHASFAEDESEKKLRFGEGAVEPRDPRLLAKGMRLEYAKCPVTCEKFLSVEEYAKLFVDGLIEEALNKERDRHQLATIKVVEGIEYNESEESSVISSIGTYVCLLEWPTIEEFSIDKGLTKIKEYISYWKFKEKWLYCINYLVQDSDKICDYYHYEAIFSIPCKQYPIAQGTASIYFTFEISNLKPKHCLVDLYYHYEGQRLKYKPGEYTSHEERLFHIIDAKIAFYKTLTF